MKVIRWSINPTPFSDGKDMQDMTEEELMDNYWSLFVATQDEE